MRQSTRLVAVIGAAVALAIGALVAAPHIKHGTPAAAESPVQAPPTLYALDSAGLQQTKQRAASGDADILRLITRLKADADKALVVPIRTVTYKQTAGIPLAPSGDPHDYYSLSDYYWPNPATADGLPYIRKDGQKNPEADAEPDQDNLEKFISASNTLAAAYYLTGNASYADRVGQLVRAWFVDPATRMNPNLNYAQLVKGHDQGQGVIDSHNLPLILDAISLISDSSTLDGAELAAINAWFGQYLSWLATSPAGLREATASGDNNNRATWYQAQVVAIAAKLGNADVAEQHANQAKELMTLQIRPDGTQPTELVRTNSWDYSITNVQAWLRLGLASRTVGVDLFAYQAQGSGSVQAALDYLAPFALGQQTWPPTIEINGKPVQQLGPFKAALVSPVMAIGAWVYPADSTLLRARQNLPASPLIRLEFPAPPL